MPKIITDERKRKINVNVSMSAETIARFDDNIDRLKNDFKAVGMDERELRRTISRSGLISEFVKILATPQGYGMIRSVISLVLGVDFKQGELFNNE